MLAHNEADVLVDELEAVYKLRSRNGDSARARQLGFYQAVVARVLATGDIQHLESSMRNKVCELLVEEIAGEEP